MVVDFQRNRPNLQPVSIEGVVVGVVSNYKLDDKLDWSANTDIFHRSYSGVRLDANEGSTALYCTVIDWLY